MTNSKWNLAATGAMLVLGAAACGDGGNSGTDGNAGADGRGAADAPPRNPSRLAVALGSASTFVVLAKSGVSTVPNSAITGNVGVSPAAASLLTGFTLTNDASN